MSIWLGEITCPKCGHWQIPMSYCPNCGFSFKEEKFYSNVTSSDDLEARTSDDSKADI
jgi:hypothetical protein